jgi:hypothetical protein
MTNGGIMDAMDRVANVLLGNREITAAIPVLPRPWHLKGGMRFSRLRVRLPIAHPFSGYLAPVQCAVATGS